MNFISVIGTPTLFDDMDIAESTKKDYLARLPQFAGFLQQQGISRNSLLEYKKYLRSRTDLGIASKNKYLAVARIALKELYRRGAVSVDLSLNVKSFRQSNKHKVEGLNEIEVEQLCRHLRDLPNSFKSKRLRALVALFLYQGLRTVEICRLNVADIDVSSGRMLIHGKGRDDKEYVFLHPQTVEALKLYMKASHVKHGHLFYSLSHTKNKKLSTRGLRLIVRKLFSEIGIDKTVHGLRHYFVTELISTYKSDLIKVSFYSRHKNLEMLQVYNDRYLITNDLKNYYSMFKSASIS